MRRKRKNLRLSSPFTREKEKRETVRKSRREEGQAESACAFGGGSVGKKKGEMVRIG